MSYPTNLSTSGDNSCFSSTGCFTKVSFVTSSLILSIIIGVGAVLFAIYSGYSFPYIVSSEVIAGVSFAVTFASATSFFFIIDRSDPIISKLIHAEKNAKITKKNENNENVELLIPENLQKELYRLGHLTFNNKIIYTPGSIHTLFKDCENDAHTRKASLVFQEIQEQNKNLSDNELVQLLSFASISSLRPCRDEIINTMDLENKNCTLGEDVIDVRHVRLDVDDKTFSMSYTTILPVRSVDLITTQDPLYLQVRAGISGPRSALETGDTNQVSYESSYMELSAPRDISKTRAVHKVLVEPSNKSGTIEYLLTNGRNSMVKVHKQNQDNEDLFIEVPSNVYVDVARFNTITVNHKVICDLDTKNVFQHCSTEEKVQSIFHEVQDSKNLSDNELVNLVSLTMQSCWVPSQTAFIEERFAIIESGYCLKDSDQSKGKRVFLNTTNEKFNMVYENTSRLALQISQNHPAYHSFYKELVVISGSRESLEKGDYEAMTYEIFSTKEYKAVQEVMTIRYIGIDKTVSGRVAMPNSEIEKGTDSMINSFSNKCLDDFLTFQTQLHLDFDAQAVGNPVSLIYEGEVIQEQVFKIFNRDEPENDNLVSFVKIKCVLSGPKEALEEGITEQITGYYFHSKEYKTLEEARNTPWDVI